MINKFQLLVLTSLVLVMSCVDTDKKKESNVTYGETKGEAEKIESPIEVKTATGKSYIIKLESQSSSLTDISLKPVDFPNTNDTFQIKDADPLEQVITQDLDENGFEEIYLITRAVGSGSYATIHGWSSNRDLSVTPIYVPEVTETDMMPDEDFYGYMGHDSIYVSNRTLFRQFPIYKEGDEQCCPTGGLKTLEYKLIKGEASWVLKIDKN